MLKRLQPTADNVLVQETSFSVDVLGRYICNTWEEATGNGGFPFDAVVIGSGMFGAYCAEQLYRAGAGQNLRVLVLEAGSFLVSEHLQNLSRIGLFAPGVVAVPSANQDPGTRALVWGIPWRSATPFPGLAYCPGGRSLYWGGWAPRLTPTDLAKWPARTRTFLMNGAPSAYDLIEREIGVVPATDYISGELYDALHARFENVIAAGVQGIDSVNEHKEGAPLAIQAAPPASGLFSFDKYSSAPILIDAIREAAGTPDVNRRLFLVPHAHVSRLRVTNGAVDEIEVYVNDQRQTLSIAPDCAVVLALGTIESTRLALDSFPTARMGRNLMAHLRSNLTVRIRRSVFGRLSRELQAAALFVRGSANNRLFHLQVTAAAVTGANPEEVMFRMVPDIDLLDRMLANQNAEWIVLTLRGIGEMVGVKDPNKALDGSWNWMNLSPFPDQLDTRFGNRPRAWVNLVTDANDIALWDAMDDASVALARALAGSGADIQYFYNKDDSLNQGGAAWHDVPPPRSTATPGFAPGDHNDPANKVRDPIGSTHHEAGTLWMGSNGNDSVTDINGRFHHVRNAYVAGPALFPTIGSANPTLTALALARRTARAIATAAGPAPSADAGFVQLGDGTLTGWQMAGSGRFIQVAPSIIESQGGPGILWYTPQTFANFVLKLEWRVLSRFDNSGIYLRTPALTGDWRVADSQGYEVQIDERGLDSSNNTEGNPLKQTGAVYDLAPASSMQAAHQIGRWNTFEITASDGDITVLLNGHPVSQLQGGTRRMDGHIGLQAHHDGARVQFRNLRIRTL